MNDSQLNPNNNNMVNTYNKRLKVINMDKIITNAQEKLTQWQEECHKKIDEFYQRKLVELNSYISQIKTNYDEKKLQIQANLSQINNPQNINEDINLTKSIINSIEQNLNDIEQTFIHINSRSLIIDDNYFHIEKKFHLQNIPQNSQNFPYTDVSSSAITSNNQYLLMHQHPYLSLIDQNSKIIKQIPWTNDWIRDMCWSSTLCAFIIITSNNIYLSDEKLGYCPALTNNIKQNWFSCTCSSESLYISTCEWGSSIYEFNILLPLDLIKQWKSPATCEITEGINDIKYNNGTIAFMIQNQNQNQNTRRIEVKSSKEFHTIWSLPLSAGSSIRLFTCCILNFNEWLVIDGTDLHIYHITKNGKIKNKLLYGTVPYRANLFNSNILAISAEYNLSLYKI